MMVVLQDGLVEFDLEFVDVQIVLVDIQTVPVAVFQMLLVAAGVQVVLVDIQMGLVDVQTVPVAVL